MQAEKNRVNLLSSGGMWKIILGSLLALVGAAREDWYVEDEEEALHLRRIADFWQEGEYHLAQGQIEEFLRSYEHSPCAPTLFTALGDLYLREKAYSQALTCYARVEGEGASHVFLNRMHCLYHLQWYATLADECEAFLQRKEVMSPTDRLEVTYFLAIALFQQCIQREQDSELLARRAEPYFALLFESELSAEVAQAFAHLSCIVKNYERASAIYLSLARQEGAASDEEMRFRAAELQAVYDPDLALATFAEILAAPHVSSEVYQRSLSHQMVLLWETGRYEQLVREYERFKLLPDAPLYLGRGFLALDRFEEAVQELQRASPAPPVRHATLLALLDASRAAGDLTTFSDALAQFMDAFPQDSRLSSLQFAKALLLKRLQKIEEAREMLELLARQGMTIPEAEQVAFELAHLDLQAGDGLACWRRTVEFLQLFPDSSLAPYAWRYRISAALQLHDTEVVIRDVEALLSVAQGMHFSPEELRGWQLFLAKSYFDAHRKEEAAKLVSRLLEGDLSVEERANGWLLLALCQEDAHFISYAEKALEGPLTWMARSDVEVSIFNHHLAEGRLIDAAHALYRAFLDGATIQEENLDWLAQDCVDRGEDEQAMAVWEALIATSDMASLSNVMQKWVVPLARLYAWKGLFERQERLLERYGAVPEKPLELELYRGELEAARGHEEEALRIVQGLLEESLPPRSFLGARALFVQAQLLEKRDPEAAALRYKTLVLQRTLQHEPLYLEAAFSYIDLRADTLEKRLALMTKWKEEVTSANDLLSQDYHAARRVLPRQAHLYECYVRLAEAEILWCRGVLERNEALQAEANELFDSLRQEKALTTRVEHCMHGLHERL